MKKWDRVKANLSMNSTDAVYFWKTEWSPWTLDDDADDDGTSGVGLGYLSYRAITFVYCFAGTVFHMVCQSKYLSFYFIFLTNWSFTLQLLHTGFYLGVLIWVWWVTRNRRKTFRAERLHWTHVIIWIMINMNAVIPYFVTLGYWGVLYNPDKVKKLTTCAILSNYLIHAVNSPLAAVDQMIMAVPIRISHVVFPLVVGLVYSLFTFFYQLVATRCFASGGDENEGVIYPLLNWRKPGRAILSSLLALVVVIVFHLLFGYGLFRLRVKLAEVYFNWRNEGGRWEGRRRKRVSNADAIIEEGDKEKVEDTDTPQDEGEVKSNDVEEGVPVVQPAASEKK